MDGEARLMWEEIGGQVLTLSPETYGQIDWLTYVSLFSMSLSQFAMLSLVSTFLFGYCSWWGKEIEGGLQWKNSSWFSSECCLSEEALIGTDESCFAALKVS